MGDEAKNLSNRRKHGVSIEEANARYLAILLLLTVAHTVREERDEGTNYDRSVDVIRIISARPATRK